MDENTIAALKELASLKTGVPAELITGETNEEIAANAAALAAFKRQHDEERARQNAEQLTTRDKFAAWVNGESTPAEVAPEPAQETNSYPTVKDGGTPQGTGYGPTDTRASFEEWFNGSIAFNPFKNNGYW